VRSLTISLLRGLAAVQVAAAHLRAEIFPGLRDIPEPTLAYQFLAFVTGFAHQAVVIFFVISGWLVGGSLLNKLASAEDAPLRRYAIDRVSRLWTVLTPALLLMLAIGGVVGEIDVGAPDAAPGNPYSIATFIGNLAGLQTILVDNFGGNYALWSLANETWYYVQFPLLLLAMNGEHRARQLLAATSVVVISAALPWALSIYFGVWLLGVLFSRVRIDCQPQIRALLAVSLLAAMLYFRIKGSNDDLNQWSFFQDVLISFPLLALLASLQGRYAADSTSKRWLATIAGLLSEFSFTLYVTHIPLIRLLRHVMWQASGFTRLAPDAPLAYAVYAAMLAVLLGAAYLFYLLFEAQTFRVRRLLKAMLIQRAPAAMLPSTPSK